MTSMVSPSSIFAGTGAGLVSAALFATLVGGATMVPLFLVAPLPLMAAGLGWGPVAGAIAGTVMLLVLEIFYGTPAASVALATVALPGVLISHMTLRRAVVDGETLRASTGTIATATAVLAALATLAGALAVGFDVRATPALVAEAVQASMARGPGLSDDPLEISHIEPLVRATVRMMPTLFPAVWALILVLDLVLADRLLGLVGRRRRAGEDLAMIAPPFAVGLVFAAGIAGAFLSGTIGILAGIAAGAAFAPLFLAGIGVITVATRGSDMRWILRATAWGLVLLFPVAALLVALVGLLDLFMPLRRGRPGARPT